MKASTTDPRVIRTRTLLRKALMELAAEKDFANLTIKDVTNQAGVNRTTFYLHYSGLHELLEDCASTLFGQMREEIFAKDPANYQEDPSILLPLVESVFDHLEEHEDFYGAMLGKHGNPLFRTLFEDFLSELIFEPIADSSSGIKPDFKFEVVIRFFIAGFTGIATWWLEKDKPISSKEAALQICRDILPGYLRLMGI